MLSKGREHDLIDAAAGYRTLTTGGSSHGRRTIHLLTACLVIGTGLRLTGAVHCPRKRGSGDGSSSHYVTYCHTEGSSSFITFLVCESHEASLVQ
ncbi:unnamed protein product [Larinioides sclopetarius]|uniref:Uncharacterized protein n=1 Tax=Larinioides sclopetarius TaxID=280406 RepID=A0AAV2B6E2_9ARAC